jgi:hypothetical protein
MFLRIISGAFPGHQHYGHLVPNRWASTNQVQLKQLKRMQKYAVPGTIRAERHAPTRNSPWDEVVVSSVNYSIFDVASFNSQWYTNLKYVRKRGTWPTTGLLARLGSWDRCLCVSLMNSVVESDS